MTKKKKYDSEDGVWRTVGGRRIFIRNGQDLSSAMRESGKFKNMRKDIQDNVKFKDMKEDTIKRQGVTAKEYQRAENNVAQLKKERNALEIEVGEYDDDDMMRGSPAHDEAKWALQRKEEELSEATKRYDKLMEKDGHIERKYKIPTKNEEYELYKRAKENPDSIDPMTENSTDWEALDKKYSSRYDRENNPIQSMANDRIKEKENTLNNDKILLDGMKKRGMKEIDGTTQEDLERRIKKNEDYLKVSKNGNDSKNWREQVKRNNELMEKELKDYEKDNSRYYDDDNYYEIFRNNERRNAKIKQEVPTEPYEYVEAYAGYHDKSYKLAGTKMSGKDVVEYGRKSWTGKEYTNDEFMEHLTDSNWHQERKMLEEAKLTNQELAYIKDRTTLSQWSVGEELTGSKNVEKMIKEAKSYYSNNSSNLMNRYSGTVSYLQNTTNMSGAEILELLKKIDEDRK